MWRFQKQKGINIYGILQTIKKPHRLINEYQIKIYIPFILMENNARSNAVNMHFQTTESGLVIFTKLLSWNMTLIISIHRESKFN